MRYGRWQGVGILGGRSGVAPTVAASLQAGAEWRRRFSSAAGGAVPRTYCYWRVSAIVPLCFGRLIATTGIPLLGGREPRHRYARPCLAGFLVQTISPFCDWCEGETLDQAGLAASRRGKHR